MKENGLNDKKTSSFSTLLANAMERASRAARVERATRWGARALWVGGVGGGALAWRLGQDASSVGINVVIVLSTALCVAVWFALKEKSGARERRASALLAARRLEKRLGGRAELFVAAVDFSEESSRDSFASAGPTSDVLRSATVEAATREYAEIEATLDAAELFAVLTETPPDRLRKIGKTRWFCALGVLANIAVWGSAEIWGSWRETQRPSVGEVASTKNEASINEGENREDKEIREKKEEEKIAEKAKTEENKAAIKPTSGTVDEELSLAALELLISELAQNAEIAESLAAELERAVAEEERGSAKGESANSAPQFLQLARELNGNLARPGTGLVAQTRRLSAAAERERRALETRWGKMGGITALERNDKEGGISGIASPENGVDETRVTGKEIAVFLTSARLAKLETKLTSAGGVGDWSALELSRVLRSDSPAERKRILTEAAARVGEWGRTLRREETTARILSESWRFDATSSRRAVLVKRAEEENRALLTRFAGRFNGDFNALNENGQGLEEAKRRFDALWKETETAEKDGVAIVERLRERLQSETAQGFIAFVCQGGVGRELASLAAEADEAACQALNDMTSQNEARRKKIAEDVENNRFGSAAARLENAVSLIPVVERKKESEELLNAEIKVISVGDAAAERTKDGGLQDERRFSALAALLTFGVGAQTTPNFESQDAFKEDVALLLKSASNGALREKDAAVKERQDGEATSGNEDGTSQDPTSQKGKSGEEGRTLAAKNKTEGKVNVGDATTWGGVLEAGRKNGAVASGEETGGENGAIAAGGSDGVGVKNVAETAENQAFNGELPAEARRRIEGTSAPEILPEYAEKIRLYRRRILQERR